MTLNIAEIFYWFVLTEILKTELTHGHEARLGALRWELLCFDEKFKRQIPDFHLAHKQIILTLNKGQHFIHLI